MDYFLTQSFATKWLGWTLAEYNAWLLDGE